MRRHKSIEPAPAEDATDESAEPSVVGAGEKEAEVEDKEAAERVEPVALLEDRSAVPEESAPAAEVEEMIEPEKTVEEEVKAPEEAEERRGFFSRMFGRGTVEKDQDY